jgi:hypothetical protein
MSNMMESAVFSAWPVDGVVAALTTSPVLAFSQPFSDPALSCPILTLSYPPQEHKKIMAEIELGNGLPDVRTTSETMKALAAAGFEVLDSQDLADTADVPWWDPVDPDSWRLSSEWGDGWCDTHG